MGKGGSGGNQGVAQDQGFGALSNPKSADAGISAVEAAEREKLQRELLELEASLEKQKFVPDNAPRKERSQNQQPKQQPARRRDGSAAIFNGYEVQALQPKIIRIVAFTLMGLLVIASAFGTEGYRVGEYDNGLAELVAQFTVKGAILGLLIQGVTIVVQWVWARNKLSGWFIGATLVSQYFSIKGFWFIGQNIAASLDFTGSAQLLVGGLIVATVTLVADLWPETKLVRN